MAEGYAALRSDRVSAANGIEYAYRDTGDGAGPGAAPLVLLQHFRGNLDGWDPDIGEFILDWNDVRAAQDPRAAALEFARSAFRHSCAACEWHPGLLASAEGSPPPVR